ncbi:STAS/SEC14 domain-containing protein [Aridibaculum aurantiacum]|uniref:STAS/SEC14 domain-containing protein n=1 Tax=Aridibaculum aurantiacum TaxID=2810307 RepID=UPI001A961785|nr:STAS/SEC14 domain-containing protein [Aridibaculum aurantiacum]
MIHIETRSNIIYTTVSGTLDNAAVDQQFDVINRALEKHEKLRWYYEMNDFEGWNITSFFKDSLESMKRTAKFDKIAMVGDKKWQNLMAQVSKALTPAEVRFFDLDQKDEAKRWIEE